MQFGTKLLQPKMYPQVLQNLLYIKFAVMAAVRNGTSCTRELTLNYRCVYTIFCEMQSSELHLLSKTYKGPFS